MERVGPVGRAGLAEAGFGGVELFDTTRLRDRYLRNRPDLPLHAATLLAVATVRLS